MATLKRTETGVVLVGADGYESREYTYAELSAFVGGVHDGEFDDLICICPGTNEEDCIEAKCPVCDTQLYSETCLAIMPRDAEE